MNICQLFHTQIGSRQDGQYGVNMGVSGLDAIQDRRGCRWMVYPEVEQRNMDIGAQLASVQQLVAQTFAQLGASAPIIRTILLKDRFFAGHKFRCGALQAVWWTGKDVIEFHDQGGKLLTAIPLEAGETKKAA